MKSQKIYAERRGSDWESLRNELSQLGRVFLGDDAQDPGLQSLLDAGTAQDGSRGAGSAAAGSAPYLDRYIADAIETHRVPLPSYQCAVNGGKARLHNASVFGRVNTGSSVNSLPIRLACCSLCSTAIPPGSDGEAAAESAPCCRPFGHGAQRLKSSLLNQGCPTGASALPVPSCLPTVPLPQILAICYPCLTFNGYPRDW